MRTEQFDLFDPDDHFATEVELLRRVIKRQFVMTADEARLGVQQPGCRLVRHVPNGVKHAETRQERR